MGSVNCDTSELVVVNRVPSDVRADGIKRAVCKILTHVIVERVST